jgi:hypothetical protein
MNIDKQFLDAVEETHIENAPSNEVIETGHKLYDFLKTIADEDGVDRGIGYGCYDLWATIDGKEVFIQVQKSNAQTRKESH